MQSIPSTYRDATSHLRLVVNALRELANGRVDSASEVTLTANATTTVVTNPRVAPTTKLFFAPLTSNAAAEQGAGTMYVSSKGDGTFTITHANNAQTNRDFDYVVLGG